MFKYIYLYYLERQIFLFLLIVPFRADKNRIKKNNNHIDNNNSNNNDNNKKIK